MVTMLEMAKKQTPPSQFSGTYDMVTSVEQMRAIDAFMKKYWEEQLTKYSELKTWLQARNKFSPSAGIGRTYEYMFSSGAEMIEDEAQISENSPVQGTKNKPSTTLDDDNLTLA